MLSQSKSETEPITLKPCDDAKLLFSGSSSQQITLAPLEFKARADVIPDRPRPKTTKFSLLDPCNFITGRPFDYAHHKLTY